MNKEPKSTKAASLATKSTTVHQLIGVVIIVVVLVCGLVGYRNYHNSGSIFGNIGAPTPQTINLESELTHNKWDVDIMNHNFSNYYYGDPHKYATLTTFDKNGDVNGEGFSAPSHTIINHANIQYEGNNKAILSDNYHIPFEGSYSFNAPLKVTHCSRNIIDMDEYGNGEIDTPDSSYGIKDGRIFVKDDSGNTNIFNVDPGDHIPQIVQTVLNLHIRLIRNH